MSRQQAIDLKIKTDREIALRAGRRLVKCDPGDEIVISGFSGSFPNSDGLPDFADNLFNKVDLISDDNRRWTIEHPEIPQRTGKLNQVNKFDAAFFGVHYKQAHTMDPMCRIILEKSYEAIVDSGNSPKSLKGSKTGVFVGACFSESEKTWFYEKLQVNGFGLTGCARAMLANRISYWLGVNGPSYSVDSACSSSLYALEHAYKAIRDGHCDSALVGGCNLCLHPYVSLQFARLGVLCADGRCKSFDEAANGYVRSEAVCVLYLQKAKNAKRVYAKVVHAKTNCDGYKEQGITYPSGPLQQRLLEEFYEECEIKPSDLAWIEAHGTGTKVGDPEEVKALENVFCPGRTGPLLIGSVKSNIGHSEPASGLCSVAKVIIAMESGFIPPNINFNTPREDITAFYNGRINVVADKTPWNGGLVGINSFGFGGANCHVLLNWNNKSKINNGLPEDDLPRLVVASGRTEEAVTSILKDFLSRSLDKEYVRLLQDVQAEQIPGHIYRGYTIIKKDCKANHSMDLQYYSGESRPVCFVFSGMGSQWTGMGTSLMKLPIFNESILKSHSILKEFGIDLVKIITSTDANILNNTVNSFVGIAAMQIALFDVLVAIGITPDIIIGHSIGELVCAYADGCLTSEQTIKVAYYYGLATLNSKIPLGAMAFVDIGYNQIKDLLPTNVEVAWHNSPDSCAISGLKESVEQFILKLKSKNISTQMINVLNTPYHSTSIKKAIPSLLEYLKNIITNPKLRSEKWFSTSVPEEQWGEDKAKYCSAEYCANNLLNSVLFDETFEHVPKGSVLIELAPHGVLQDVLNRSHKINITNVDLASRNHKDGIDYLLSAFGKIFEAGLNPKISNLYPDIEFPVSRGTPMIAPLVRWEHSEDWYVTMYRVQDKIKSGERNISISLKDEEHEYLSGHVIDGRNLFPATGYLVMAWETLALMRGELYSEVPVVFENVRFQRATNIPKDGNVEFIVMVQKGSGTFEVVESGAPVVTGRLYIPTDVNNEMIDMPPHPDEPNDTDLNTKDIYKELRLRGYNYKGMFRSLNRVNLDATVGRVGWFNNWVAFMDNMLQIQILKEDTRALFVPTSLQKLFINVKKHATVLQTLPEEKPEFPVYVYPEIDLIQAGGVEIRGLHANVIAKRKPLADPVIEKYTFVPNIIETGYTLEQIVRISLHLVIENLISIKVKTVEILNKTFNPDVQILSPIILDVLADLPLIQPEVSILSDGTHPQLKEIGSNITVEDKKLSSDQSVLLAVGSGVLQDSNLMEQVFASLKPGGFLLTREKLNVEYSPDSVEVCLDASLEQERLMLVRKPLEQNIVPIVVKISSTEFSWLPVLQKLLKADDASVSQKIVLVGEKDPTNGIVGLLNCIRKEPGGDRVRCIFIMDKCAPSFSLDEPLYRKQLNKDLILNVYKNKVWGSYRHLLLEPPSLIEVQHSCANSSIRGDLSSLKWFQGSIVPFTKQPAESDLVHVYYTALNFRDIMLATAKLAPEVIARGRINQESVIGFEYSGRLESGERVMGMITSRALTNILVYDKYLSWKVPDSWSLEEAATVPVVYGTVIYALIVSGRMKRGDSVLIHAGTGGVGQAAITIALYYECEIFTTVGTAEKREFIKTHFPQIPESHIGNSRDSSFEQMIMMETDGKGVDMVLNSLAEEKLLASVRCLATGGRFLEIGKFDLANNSMIGMELFLKEISFHGVMLDTLFDSPNEWKEIFQRQVQENIDSGAIRPLVRTVFESDQVEPAFRYMAAGKHIGKVLIKIRDEEEDRFIKPQSINVKAYPRVTFDENSSCIICGGLGGFGLELADWMVLRNSRNIILTTRTGIRNGYQALRKRVWESYGAKVVISTADITTEEGVKQLLNEANKLGPVSTIFNLAVVLKDALFENQTEEDFKASAGPKSIATALLDKYSRTMCPELKHFVIFSSVSCGRGNAGQTNYGMSNSVMERICEIRHSEGLPALAVEWGAVGEVGLVADMAEDNQEVVIGGTLQQKIGNCLEILDDLLTQKNNPIVSSMVVAEKRASSSNAGTIVDTVINILGLRDLKTISLHSTLAELGMDSMMAVEIKQTLERQFEVFLTPQDIRSMTFAKLQEIGSSDDKEKKAEVDPKSIAQMPDVGLGYLIRAIGEESSAYNSIMRIPSLCEDGSVVEQPTTKLNTLFVIPGLEGISSMMEPLSNNLNMQVLCLQYDILGTASTIEEMAAAHYTLIQERLSADQEFSIVGYSFGGLIAIEVLKILEKNNRTGKLWLIDSAPAFLKMTTELAIRGDKTQDQEIQVQLILRFLDLVWPHNKTKITTELHQKNSWEERLNYFIEQIPDDTIYSKDYQKQLLNCAYIKLKAIINYDGKPNGSLKTNTVLIRPIEQVLPISEDYGLSEIVGIHIAFKLASFDENNEFESKKRKKHKKDKYEDKEKSGGLKLILKVGSGSCLPADEIVSNTNGNHETNDYLSKSHKKKKKKHKHHKEKKKRMRDDITIHEEISLGEETLAEAPMSKRPTNFENNSRVTTNSTEPQNVEWKSEETNNTNENRQTLQQLLTHLLRALERRDPQQLFAWPVTDRIAPNYSRLISKPMDFETIRRSIQSDLYTSLNAFVADFKLMCENAMTYNQPETIYYKAAKRLLHAGLKLTGPEKLKTLLSALPGMANIPPSQLGFDITQEYHGDTSNDTIIENIERSSERLHDNDLLNQRKIISKFEAIPDNLTPDEILKQAQNAAKAASEKLATKNTKMGFLKQQNNGSTSLSILVPNDGINPETGERPVLLGSLIGKLSHGVGSIPGFREDRRNMVKTVKPLYYGAFGSYAPTYDSTFANLTKDESDLVLRTYGDEASAQYAESILNFTKDSDYAMTMADNLLDLMTGGDHRKTKRVLDERKKQQVVLDDTKKSVSQLHQPSSCQPLATTLINTGSSNTTTVNHQTKSAPIQIDQLKSLSELGIDTKFIDYYQEQSVFQDRLDHVGGLLGRLQNVQNQRLSAPLPQHLSQIAHPSPQEIQLADKITESLAENLKRVPPSAVMSVTGVRKAMGIAQISHLELNQNNCHPSNLVNHGSSHQQTQVSLIGDGIQDRVEGVEGTVSGVDLESELREFLESDPTLTSFPLHDENDRTIEEILSES